ncbi:hypothetical protein GTW66_13985 [Streptomyces sp. SID5473]|uniref:Uncharacterized protein n=2 Tax=Streptomyces TaxID=1883 RepID=I2MT30_STRT9|nr:hypothetical protein B7R87_33045 [Streptomyces tsukubensis]EIF87927.1 hypothetical protein [Streptomyces tsukubensis NRRL18488]MYS65139.1 hypothetical protein [Streptomyces sp. SID5473]QKM65794.1 hypothetical protein STSU_000060 [Streptomyces tsukubensis NRRL18488]
MYEHIQIAAETFSVGDKVVGSVGMGGLATALTVGMVAGIKEPKGAGKIRRKLDSNQASVIGIVAGTCYMGAGSIWTVGEGLSDGFASVFTNGGFGHAGMGAVSLLLGAVMYFREARPAAAAFTGILAAGVWAQSGGIWGLPEALVLTGVQSLGMA